MSNLISDSFEKYAKKLEFNRGDFVYREGDSPKGLYFVRAGLVGLIASSLKGHEHLLRLFKCDQFFGHRSLFAEEPYHANAISIEPTTIKFVDKKYVEEVVTQSNELLLSITKTMAKELRLAELRRVSIADDDVLSRVASSIIVLKELYPHHKWTRAEIANFCASTTPTVIRSLAELERRGFIEQKSREFNILDRKALVQLGQ